MKLIPLRIVTLLVGAWFFTAPVIHAQQPNPFGGRGLAERIGAMVRELQLTDDQQSQLREVFMAEAEKLAPLFQDQSLSREDKMRKFQEWGDQLDTKIQPILTPEQFQKYKDKKEAMKNAGQRHHPQSLDRLKDALKSSDEEWALIKPRLEEVTSKQRERLSPAGVPAIQELQKAVGDSNVPAAEIQRLAEAVRAHHREKDAALKTARERLREVLTARQEAVLLLYGILD